MKQTIRHSQHPKPDKCKSPVQALPAMLSIAFGCGVGMLLLLLCAFSFIMEKVSLPAGAAVPMAGVAAGCGVIITAIMVSNAVGRYRLLCGLGCGIFYLSCLAAATLLTGNALSIGGTSATMTAIILLSGAVGGLVSAARVQNGAQVR